MLVKIDQKDEPALPLKFGDKSMQDRLVSLLGMKSFRSLGRLSRDDNH